MNYTYLIIEIEYPNIAFLGKRCLRICEKLFSYEGIRKLDIAYNKVSFKKMYLVANMYYSLR